MFQKHIESIKGTALVEPVEEAVKYVATCGSNSSSLSIHRLRLLGNSKKKLETYSTWGRWNTFCKSSSRLPQ